MDNKAQGKTICEPVLCDLLAQLRLGDCTPMALVDWATNELVLGRDTPSLRILAGLSGKDLEEVDFYLQKTFYEMGVDWPSRQDCLFGYCGRVARKILNREIPAREGFKNIYRVVICLGYPRELDLWLKLDTELCACEDMEDGEAEAESYILEQASRLADLLDAYGNTGLFRLSAEQSIAFLQNNGWEDSIITADPSKAEKVVEFFRLFVTQQDFQYLTIPKSSLCRSDFRSVTFNHSDLHMSSLCWCDFEWCHFRGADLRGCDLRRSIFKNCYFNEADLSGADLRGAKFERCVFSYAGMDGVKLDKRFGLSRRLRAKELALSEAQIAAIDWVGDRGKEPAGG